MFRIESVEGPIEVQVTRRFENETRLPKPCHKVPFSKKDAATIVNNNKRQGKRRKGRNEVRYYYCAECNAYHLTSRDEKQYTRSNKIY